MVDVTSRDLAEELEKLKRESSRKLIQFPADSKLLDLIGAYAKRHDVSTSRATRELVFVGTKILEIVDEGEHDAKQGSRS